MSKKQRIVLVKKNEDFLYKVLKNTGILQCHYCGRDLVVSPYHLHAKTFPNQATVDHVIPVSKGGSVDDDSNRVPCCPKCNVKKGDKILKIC